MQRSSVLIRIIKLLACLLVLKTTVVVLLAFPDYFPPNFRSDFLLGREGYFFGPYQWAFYFHIFSGPFALLSGLVLLSEKFRQWRPQWHRWIGRLHVGCVLLLMGPSGLWMAFYSEEGGPVGSAGFVMLSLATMLCIAKGWRSAVRRRFAEHRRWMQRGFALLCSAVVLRLIGGMAGLLVIDWTYPYAAWLSWLLPLFALEGYCFIQKSLRPQAEK